MGSLKNIVVWILISSSLFGAKVTLGYWEKGKTFSEYLDDKEVSKEILKDISKADIQFLSDIEGGQLFYELKDNNGTLEQALIPIGEEMQIRLAKEHNSDVYNFNIIPIEYKEKEHGATVIIEQNLYTDVNNALHHPALADKIGQLFKGAVNTRKFQKGDKVSFIYSQKTRMGQPHAMPYVKIALHESRKKRQFIYADEDGYGYISTKKSQAYTVKGKEKVTYTRRVPVKSTSSRFGMPLRHIRITSSFSHRRYHPILKRYRPHHGTDFGARRGTPLLAVNAGKVNFSGRMGGYGKVVKIRHPGGYESLYAHQSRIRVKRGQQVKKGQIIGYVGSTGRSTGPHLHFGMKKNGRWIDPMKVLRKTSIQDTVLKKITEYKDVTKTKYKKVVIKNAKENKEKLLAYLKEESAPFVWDGYEQISMGVEDGKQDQAL
jgi:murein DD-endopeptidase MepM/ murein hydrolase activator NlpD